MNIIKRLEDDIRASCGTGFENISEIRIRRHSGYSVRYADGRKVYFEPSSGQAFDEIVSEMMEHSLYSREKELAQGFFHMHDGMRAGIAADFKDGNVLSVSDISSVCVRIPHEIKGCADGILKCILNSIGTLIISPPAMGKTTLLRDAVRQISDMGYNVVLIDERMEVSGNSTGHRLDVGRNTDVITGMKKSEAIMHAIRSLAPEFIAADELGGRGDVDAVTEAIKCGIKVICTVHGDSTDHKYMRRDIAELTESGAFKNIIWLGPKTGKIRCVEDADR